MKYFPNLEKKAGIHRNQISWSYLNVCVLIFQDKSCSLAVHSAQALLNTGDDIIAAHAGSHLTIAHMAVLANHSLSTVFVCGVKSSEKAAELRNLFSHMGCKSRY